MAITPTVVLADDDCLARDIVAASCARRGITVLATTSCIDELVQVCTALQPDVVVARDAMGELDVIQALQCLQELDVPLILLSGQPGPYPLTLLSAGHVWGHVSHDASPSGIADAILAVARGGMVLDPDTATEVVQEWRRLRGARRP